MELQSAIRTAGLRILTLKRPKAVSPALAQGLSDQQFAALAGRAAHLTFDRMSAVVSAQNDLTSKVLERCETREKFAGLMRQLFDYPRYGCPFKRGSRYDTQFEAAFYFPCACSGRMVCCSFQVLCPPRQLQISRSRSRPFYWGVVLIKHALAVSRSTEQHAHAHAWCNIATERQAETHKTMQIHG